MADYGLTTEGFFIPTISDIRDGIEGDVRGEFGESLPLGDKTWLGHLIGILSEQLGLLWELGEVLYSAVDPDAASGAALQALSLITGTFKADAQPSTVVLTLCGDDGTTVSDGNVVQTVSTAKRFITIEDGNLEDLTPWTISTLYSVGDRASNSARAYQVITAGTSAGSGGPTTTDDDITDGTAHWIYLGEGTAVDDVESESEDTGEIVAIAGDLASIQTPVGGWNTAINLLDAEQGRDAATDEDLRLLREAELAQAGTGTPDALRAALLQLPGVTNVIVFFNPDDATDAEGLAGHSCECLVQGGADQDIWDVLWNNVPIGIITIGDEVGVVVDDEGYNQTLRFTRPEEILIWVAITLEYEALEYDGDTAVQTAISVYGQTTDPGRNAVASAVSAAVFKTVGGVLDVSEVLIGLVDPPVASTTIAITRRQLAVYDTSRVDVTSSEGTP